MIYQASWDSRERTLLRHHTIDLLSIFFRCFSLYCPFEGLSAVACKTLEETNFINMVTAASSWNNIPNPTTNLFVLHKVTARWISLSITCTETWSSPRGLSIGNITRSFLIPVNNRLWNDVLIALVPILWLDPHFPIIFGFRIIKIFICCLRIYFPDIVNTCLNLFISNMLINISICRPEFQSICIGFIFIKLSLISVESRVIYHVDHLRLIFGGVLKICNLLGLC